VDRNDLDESFLTVAEVAEILKLNQQTVRNWIDQGLLPAVRVGRRVRIRRSDFERLLEAGYSAGTVAKDDGSGPSAADFWSGEASPTPAP
jgi:excisionase family DNA binding protein